MVGLQMPAGGLVNVFLKGPGATRATVVHSSAVPIVGVHRGVGGVGLVNHLEFDSEIGGLAVECVHAGVGYRDVERPGSLSDNTEESVNWVNGQVRHGQITVVHFNHRDGVVLSFPTEVVTPPTEVVLSVANGKVWGRIGSTLKLSYSH